jgi:hypothetical protein
MSTNLNAPALTTGQANPETTTNDAVGAIDAAVTETLAVNLTSDVTLTSAQYRSAVRFSVTTTGTSKSLTLPAIKRLVLISNDGTLAISVKVGSTTTSLAVAEAAMFYSDGTTNGLIKVVFGTTVNPYDIAFFIPGVGSNSQKVLRFNADRSFTLPATLTGSIVTAGTAATGSTVFTLKKNGSSIGTATFASSGTTATFSFASDVTFAATDVFSIDGPGTADATLADMAFTFKGTR